MKQIIYLSLLTLTACSFFEPAIVFTLEYYNEYGFILDFREDGTYRFKEQLLIPGGHRCYGTYTKSGHKVKLSPSLSFEIDGTLLGPKIRKEGRHYYIRRCALPSQYPIYMLNGQVCDTITMWELNEDYGKGNPEKFWRKNTFLDR